MLTGCSFMFMQGPPDSHAKLSYFDCVSSAAAPVTDTTLASVYGLVTAVGLADDTTEDGSAPPPLLFGGLAALHLASAIYGYIDAKECHSAKQELAHRIHLRAQASTRRINALERALEARKVTGCSSDAECKGDRICSSGSCAVPPASAPLTPQASPPVAPTSPTEAPSSGAPPADVPTLEPTAPR